MILITDKGEWKNEDMMGWIALFHFIRIGTLVKE